MSDDGDSLVLRLLREMRADMATKGDLAVVRADVEAARADTSDLRRDVSEGFAAITATLAALSHQNADTRAELGRQIGDLRTEIRTERDAGRIAGLEARVADLEG
ncbi:MAG TPA: hypothetical protein VGP07_19825, partial [Polyangia bacterium]